LPKKDKKLSKEDEEDVYYPLALHEKPLDLDNDIWENLQVKRKAKIEKEVELKKLTRLLSEMSDHRNRLIAASEASNKLLAKLMDKKAVNK
jgi:hypothetical protein